jgi:methionyl aminopeptidase
MIDLKTKQEIQVMLDGGKRLASVLQELLDFAQPGISLTQIDKKALQLIQDSGASPSFTTVKGYKWPTCLCVNEAVVHCIPTSRILADGDVLTIDVGLIYKGFHTDTAWTKIVGNDPSKEKSEKERFLEVGQNALREAIALAAIGTHIGTISASTQRIIESAGYSIIKSLVGHGVGRNLHEDPQVPNYERGDYRNTYQFVGGETIAIEPIYVMGKPSVVYDNNDGWTIATRDRSLAAVFEHSLAITENGPLVLTALG